MRFDIFILAFIETAVVIIIFVTFLYGLISLNVQPLIYLVLALLFLFFLYKIGKDIFTQRFRRIITFFLISGLLALIGFQILQEADSLVPNIDKKYGFYRFTADSSPHPINIYNFNIEYDFSKNYGNISFSALSNQLQMINNLRIEVPKELKINNVRLYEDFVDTDLELDRNYTLNFRYQNENWTYIDVRNFNITNDTSNINFFFELAPKQFFSPNGKFEIKSNTKRVFNDFGKGLVAFNLGYYECKPNCYGNLNNALIDIENNMIVVELPQNYYDNLDGAYRVLYQEFSLNTENKIIKTTIDAKRSLGIGIVSASIVLLFQSLGEWILYQFSRKTKKQSISYLQRLN